MATINGKSYIGLRFHKVIGKEEYLYIDMDSFYRFTGVYEYGVGSLISIDDPNPAKYDLRMKVNGGCRLLTSIRPSPVYLTECTEKVLWDDIPAGWQKLLFEQLEDVEIWNQDKISAPEVAA